jgi:hypothetical protein
MNDLGCQPLASWRGRLNYESRTMAINAPKREQEIFVMAAGTLMVLAILFGVLELLNVIHV